MTTTAILGAFIALPTSSRRWSFGCVNTVNCLQHIACHCLFWFKTQLHCCKNGFHFFNTSKVDLNPEVVDFKREAPGFKCTLGT